MAQTSTYHFILDGVLSERAAAAFPELQVRIDTRHHTTSLYGTLSDPTGMRSVLARFDDLGLTLLEMRRLPI